MKYIIPFVILLLFVLVVWYFRMTPSMPAFQQISHVTVGSTTVQVEVADTEAKRELGLSFRDSLLSGNGMLFVFDSAGAYGFWMKDMSFNIDMIFADASGRVVTIYKDVAPDSYLKDPPANFYPTSPAKYVLEVLAGFADEHGIALGDKFVLQ